MKTFIITFPLLLSLVQSRKCHKCASVNVASNWHATGLPSLPADTEFSSNCINNLNEKAQKDCNGTSCFVEVFNLQGIYSVVRGCADELISGTNIPAASTGDHCTYSKENGVTQLQLEATSVLNPFVGVATCSDSDGCNNENLASATVTFAKVKWGNANCKEQTAFIQCLECTHFDGYGWCEYDTRKRCTGAYCTKVVGTLGGRRFEHRGCSAFNPLQVDYCMDFNTVLNASMIGMQINQKLKGTQCLCNSQRCNGAFGQNQSGFGLISLLFMIVLAKICVGFL